MHSIKIRSKVCYSFGIFVVYVLERHFLIDCLLRLPFPSGDKIRRDNEYLFYEWKEKLHKV